MNQLGPRMPDQCVPGRQSYVNQGQDLIDKEASRFSELTERLIGRLERILRPHKPETCDPCGHENSGVPLADDLHNISQRLRLQNDLLQLTIDRIEL
jgi:hypothetical protein